MFFETNMEKLFESRKDLTANAAIPEVDAEIKFYESTICSVRTNTVTQKL